MDACPEFQLVGVVVAAFLMSPKILCKPSSACPKRFPAKDKSFARPRAATVPAGASGKLGMGAAIAGRAKRAAAMTTDCSV